MARFADITGWRVPSEVLTLQWRQVDFGSGQVRLDPGTTKNGEGRVVPMTAALRELVEAQRAERNRLRAERGSLCPFVFHRNGVPITAFTKASKTACLKAGARGGFRTTSGAPRSATWCGLVSRSGSRRR